MASETKKVQEALSQKKSIVFPKYIEDNPYFELTDETQDTTALQKQDFLMAIDYANKKILTKPLQEWTEESFLEDLITLNKISVKTLLKKYDSTDTTAPVCTSLGYRSGSNYALRTAPLLTYVYNLSQPWDNFSALQTWDRLTQPNKAQDSATNYIKWYLKMVPLNPTELALLEENMKLILAHLSINFENWKKRYFDGKSIVQWHADFYSGPGKQFAFPASALSSPDKTFTAACERTFLPDLTTPEERAAALRVVKIFPKPEAVPQLMKNLASSIIKMIKAGEDPIHIIAYLKYTLLHEIHPFPNANARSMSIIANCILLLSDYPALSRTDKAKKWVNSFSVQSSQNPLQAIERQLKDRMKSKLTNDLCILMRDGKKLSKEVLRTWISKGADLNFPLGNNWTVLHFACFAKNWEMAALLVSEGALLSNKTSKNVTALEMAKKQSPEEAAKLERAAEERENGVSRDSTEPKAVVFSATEKGATENSSSGGPKTKYNPGQK